MAHLNIQVTIAEDYHPPAELLRQNSEPQAKQSKHQVGQHGKLVNPPSTTAVRCDVMTSMMQLTAQAASSQ